MTDHEVDPGQRVIALASLHLAEARARAGVGKVLLESLGHHARSLTRDDQHDFALAVWEAFASDAACPSMPLDMQAAVFASAALYLREDVILRIARETWGDRRVEAGDDCNRVTWMPEDEMLVLNVGHLHSDGTRMRAQFVISPMRMAGWVS
ncbi:hypothetical protein [Microbacterium sp. cx-59]|uniref:hypothetical protein n=1 Tax=Microbacterium sp. cx-59 TaxID=2891207 RepID=UPI001E5BDAFA|nr:hypothetical protein [Microbacterium sp. cx-59]MCC4906930.1 hypothetical protein [Microbacterium sp. cx-59]